MRKRCWIFFGRFRTIDQLRDRLSRYPSHGEFLPHSGFGNAVGLRTHRFQCLLGQGGSSLEYLLRWGRRLEMQPRTERAEGRCHCPAWSGRGWSSKRMRPAVGSEPQNKRIRPAILKALLFSRAPPVASWNVALLGDEESYSRVARLKSAARYSGLRRSVLSNY